MAYGLVGLYALFFIFVGAAGNAGPLINNVKNDGKNYLVWILAIVILRALYTNQKARPVIGAFSTLVFISFFMMHYKTIAAQINELTGKNLFNI